MAAKRMEKAADLGAAGAARHPQRDCKPIGVTEKPPKTEKKKAIRDNGGEGPRGREDSAGVNVLCFCTFRTL